MTCHLCQNHQLNEGDSVCRDQVLRPSESRSKMNPYNATTMSNSKRSSRKETWKTLTPPIYHPMTVHTEYAMLSLSRSTATPPCALFGASTRFRNLIQFVNQQPSWPTQRPIGGVRSVARRHDGNGTQILPVKSRLQLSWTRVQHRCAFERYHLSLDMDFPSLQGSRDEATGMTKDGNWRMVYVSYEVSYSSFL